MQLGIGNSIPLFAGRRASFGLFGTAHLYDGDNDYQTRGAGFTGASDGNELTIAFAIKLVEGGKVETVLRSNQGKVHFYDQASDLFRCTIKDTANAQIVDLIADDEVDPNDGWTHLAFSMNNDAGTARAWMARNGVIVAEDNSVVNNTAIDLTAGDWGLAAEHTGTSKIDGFLSQILVAPEYISDPATLYNGGVVDIGDGGANVLSGNAFIAMRDGKTQTGAGGTMTVTGDLGEPVQGPPLAG